LKYFNEIPSGSYFEIEGKMEPEMIIACKCHLCQWYLILRLKGGSSLSDYLRGNSGVKQSTCHFDDFNLLFTLYFHFKEVFTFVII
jgi:hypothetical protein